MGLRVLLTLAILACWQSAPPVRADDNTAIVRDESFELNIAQRRIERGPYEASLQVGIDGPLTVRAGAAAQAARIVLTLNQVHGSVRFHGDVSRLRDVFTSHTGAQSAKENK